MSALTKQNYYNYEEEQLQVSRKKRVIKKKKTNRISLGVIKNWLIILTIFWLSISIIYNYAMITDKKMDIKNLEEEIDDLNAQIDKYNIFLEGLNNTNTIENYAKSYLGMNYPNRKQTVFIEVSEAKAVETEANNEKSNNFSLLEQAIKFFQ